MPTLDIRYRPQDFEEMFGNKTMLASLESVLTKERFERKITIKLKDLKDRGLLNTIGDILSNYKGNESSVVIQTDDGKIA